MRASFISVAAAAITILSGCASASVVPGRADHFIMRDMVGKLGAFAIVPDAKTQPVIRAAPPEVVKAMLAMSWLGAQEPAGTFLIWSDTVPSYNFVPTLVMQLQGDIKNSGGCEVVDWTAVEDVNNWKGMLATMDGSHGGGYYMTSLGNQFTLNQRGSGSGSIVLCPTRDPATIEVYGTDHDPRWHGETHDAAAELYAGTFTVNVPEVKNWIYTNGKAGHFIIKGAKPPPEDDWLGPKPVPAARQQELAAGK